MYRKHAISDGTTIMASLEQLVPDIEEFVREKVQQSVPHQDISRKLQEMYPSRRGLSERSIRRFCKEHGEV